MVAPTVNVQIFVNDQKFVRQITEKLREMNIPLDDKPGMSADIFVLPPDPNLIKQISHEHHSAAIFVVTDGNESLQTIKEIVNLQIDGFIEKNDGIAIIETASMIAKRKHQYQRLQAKVNQLMSA